MPTDIPDLPEHGKNKALCRPYRKKGPDEFHTTLSTDDPNDEVEAIMPPRKYAAIIRESMQCAVAYICRQREMRCHKSTDNVQFCAAVERLRPGLPF